MTGVSFDDLPLARATVDRAAHLRADPAALVAALTDPRTRVLLVGDGAIATRDDGVSGPPAADGWGRGRPARPLDMAYLDPAAARESVPGHDGQRDDRWLLLGRTDDGGLVLALRVPSQRPAPATGRAADELVHRPRREPSPLLPPLPPGLVWSPLRTVGADLGAADAGLATTAVALDTWHRRHTRCPRCGAATRVVQAGWARVCPDDGSEHFPRTDPAVIMAVVDDDDRLLLGHAAAWPPGRFSTLAGFVEAGESAEHAVRREVAEEAGVEVGGVEYRGSQPWPFPASLMLGFRARALTTVLSFGDDELTDARWFTRAELAAAVRAGEVLLPGPASIARALIEDWFGRPLPEAPPPA